MSDIIDCCIKSDSAGFFCVNVLYENFVTVTRFLLLGEVPTNTCAHCTHSLFNHHFPFFIFNLRYCVFLFYSLFVADSDEISGQIIPMQTPMANVLQLLNHNLYYCYQISKYLIHIADLARTAVSFFLFFKVNYTASKKPYPYN